MNWSEMQRNALMAFLQESSPVRAGLQIFLQEQAASWRELCAQNMAVVPRNPESASDFAARAQAFDEFWRLLEFAVAQELTNAAAVYQQP